MIFLHTIFGPQHGKYWNANREVWQVTGWIWAFSSVDCNKMLWHLLFYGYELGSAGVQCTDVTQYVGRNVLEVEECRRGLLTFQTQRSSDFLAFSAIGCTYAIGCTTVSMPGVMYNSRALTNSIQAFLIQWCIAIYSKSASTRGRWWLYETIGCYFWN